MSTNKIHRIGAHISSGLNDVYEGIKELNNYGGQSVQLFVSNNNKYKPVYEKFKKFADKNNITIIVHASYTINLAREHETYPSNIHQFIAEIKIAYELGAKYIVVHMGKSINLSKEEAYNNMYISLLDVHMQTIKYPIKILLETSTGQGSEICYKLEEFAYFFNKLCKNKNKNISERFGICIDTCHIFAAGYDLRDKKSIISYLEAFEELIGVRYINLVHLNDSKKDIGSNIDRHENIGKGYIGTKGLYFFAKKIIELNIPIILETPSPLIINDLQNIINYQKEYV